ncbi:hypothetical protein [Sporomusa sp. KB1]|jgi:membrane protein YdbS with pleckstrin-like domain|uniref:hypothetical protein n=1 Tax=Sporomusa sp. KB1 TaxID=943346 RepID=UPI0011A5B922|nr:hypothetical protein [Sporomusa sp. KB1]TWH46882.1 hypothetical protein Salpa_2905 [Sporomusa sp. KB1]
MSTAKKSLEISWLGLDGFLVVLYFIAVGVIYYAITAQNDWIVGQAIPYGIMITVTIIFINYLLIVLKFNKSQDKNL